MGTTDEAPKRRRRVRRLAPADPTCVVGYVRVSTEEQAREGLSLSAQEAKLRAYCDLYELELVAVVSDAGVSAKSLERPGLASALAALESGAAEGGGDGINGSRSRVAGYSFLPGVGSAIAGISLRRLTFLRLPIQSRSPARVAELVDAQVSEACPH